HSLALGAYDTTLGPACYSFNTGRPDPRPVTTSMGRVPAPNEVILSGKGAKSRTHGRSLRSTGTKARTRVGRNRISMLDLNKKLEARERELAEALARQAATAEALRAIANSATDAEMALRAIAERAARLPGVPH